MCTSINLKLNLSNVRKSSHDNEQQNSSEVYDDRIIFLRKDFLKDAITSMTNVVPVNNWSTSS